LSIGRTLTGIPDGPAPAYPVACSKPGYELLRVLYEEQPATAKHLADARGVTVAAISPTLQKLTTNGLVRPGGATPAGTTHELTREGQRILLQISGIEADEPPLDGWVVASTVCHGDPTSLRQVLRAAKASSYQCAGDADFLSVLSRDDHDLAIALESRVRALGSSASRVFVIGPVGGEQ
jgi:DNA-binding MarR family transcriptional regulator